MAKVGDEAVDNNRPTCKEYCERWSAARTSIYLAPLLRSTQECTYPQATKERRVELVSTRATDECAKANVDVTMDDSQQRRVRRRRRAAVSQYKGLARFDIR